MSSTTTRLSMAIGVLVILSIYGAVDAKEVNSEWKSKRVTSEKLKRPENFAVDDEKAGFCAVLRRAASKSHQRNRQGVDSGRFSGSKFVNEQMSDEDTASATGAGLCCAGRNDQCSMPYQDTICYCDSFCDRDDVSDCCPDYQDYCLNQKPSAAADDFGGNLLSHGSIVPPSADGEVAHQLAPEQLEVLNNCLHENLVYSVGEVIHIDCNECTCVESIDDVQYFKWSCTEKRCAITQKLVDFINSENAGWRAEAYPDLVVMTLDEAVKEKLGTQRPSEKSSEMNNMKLRVDNNLPDRFDAREKWPGLIGQPHDQGKCGASWAFSTAGIAADRLAIHSRGAATVRLSTQQLISCVGHHNGNGDHTKCHSLSFDKAWWFVRKNGLVTEECYPYSSGLGDSGQCLLPRHAADISSSTCPSQADQPVTVYHGSPPYKIEPQEREIMKEIIHSGPVQAIMTVKHDFYAYKTGVYRSLVADDDDYHPDAIHSVKIIGWGIDESTEKPLKYWLCTNSWGQNWGENGHFRIARGTNESAIETLIVGVWMRGNGHHGNGQTLHQGNGHNGSGHRIRYPEAHDHR